MNSGVIVLQDGPRGVDLQSTLESAQSFLWQRVDGRMYEETSSHGSEDWYYTVVADDIVFVRQQNDRLEWRSTTDATDLLHRRLRLDDDLDEIFASFPADQTLDEARRTFLGLRVVRDPFFPCLISFICSARRLSNGSIHSNADSPRHLATQSPSTDRRIIPSLGPISWQQRRRVPFANWVSGSVPLTLNGRHRWLRPAN